ncbi:DNA recombination protein RmuC [Candidatus Poribacteria bacterium]|nr:MAG: DNA recombination protein RmuC [Candidatus Poribacteria bacterium]
MSIIDIVLGILLLVVIVLLIMLIRRSHINSKKLKEINLLREAVSSISNTLTNQFKNSSDTLVNTLKVLGNTQTEKLDSVTKSINTLTESNENRFENVRKTLNERLDTLQKSNENKLDQMRKTVDEQLQSTLEKRLTESFKVVSERLEAVREGLGKMENLASDVGNLQRVLSNVSTRGALGEFQLGAILEQILTPDQYSQNVQPHMGPERVEYAIRLPGDNKDRNTPVWLPIDSKFPMADYERLVDAREKADKDAEQKEIKALIRTVRTKAKDISKKYISPPDTTEFAIMFLSIEGLYAEVLRQPGEVAELLQKHRIVVAGPTTLASILFSLHVGFQTLSIQKHSSEIRKLLAAVKTEFGMYHNALKLTQRQLKQASNNLEEAGNRSQKVVDKLREVEDLPPVEAAERLGLPETELANELSE